MKIWGVYLLLCYDGTLYCGISNDIEKRVSDHNKSNGAKYTKKRLPVKLVWQTPSENRSTASKLEAKIKKLSREQKLNLIIKQRAEKILNYTRKAPKMFAVTRESFCNRVATVIEMCDLNFDVHKFYALYLNLQGSIYRDSQLEIDDAWARLVVDDALKIINVESKM